jgi:hypothetical protein
MWILHHSSGTTRTGGAPGLKTDIKPLPISEVQPMIGLAFQNAGLQPSLFEIPINERAAYPPLRTSGHAPSVHHLQ